MCPFIPGTTPPRDRPTLKIGPLEHEAVPALIKTFVRFSMTEESRAGRRSERRSREISSGRRPWSSVGSSKQSRAERGEKERGIS